jgi:hypothetical protein
VAVEITVIPDDILEKLPDVPPPVPYPGKFPGQVTPGAPVPPPPTRIL